MNLLERHWEAFIGIFCWQSIIAGGIADIILQIGVSLVLNEDQTCNDDHHNHGHQSYQAPNASAIAPSQFRLTFNANLQVVFAKPIVHAELSLVVLAVGTVAAFRARVAVVAAVDSGGGAAKNFALFVF